MSDGPYWDWDKDSELNNAPILPALKAIDSRFFLAKRIAIISGIASLCLSLFAIVNFAGASSNSSTISDLFNSTSSSVSDSPSTTPDILPDTSWIPTGFNTWSSDSNIAWRWSDANSYTCGDYGCISAEFISQNGCSTGLYAAINWMDKEASQAGSVVSYANASLPSLRAMQIAKLKFNDIEGTGKSGQMATINCY